MNLDPTVLAFRSTAEGAEKILNELEAELASVKSRRDVILNDISKANDAAVRDQRERMKLPGLNKQEAEAGRLIVSITTQVAMAKKRVAMAEAAEAGRARAAEANGEPGRLIQLEIRAPDGRVLRQWHKSVDAARAALTAGYEITGEVISGNIVSPVGPGTRPFMKALLDSQGDVLRDWLAEQGIVGNPDPVKITLPHNGRDLQ
jgi:hypothetical protein